MDSSRVERRAAFLDREGARESHAPSAHGLSEEEKAGSSRSVLAVPPPNRLEKLLCVVPDAVLEDDFHVFDVSNLLRRIASDHHEVRVLARGD